MDFNRKFDYGDQYAFLPDNKTIGTKEYFKRKYGEKFPEYIYDLLEANHRQEYSEEDKAQLLEAIFAYQREQNEKLMREFEERSAENVSHDNVDERQNKLSNDVFQSDLSQ